MERRHFFVPGEQHFTRGLPLCMLSFIQFTRNSNVHFLHLALKLRETDFWVTFNCSTSSYLVDCHLHLILPFVVFDLVQCLSALFVSLVKIAIYESLEAHRVFPRSMFAESCEKHSLWLSSSFQKTQEEGLAVFSFSLSKITPFPRQHLNPCKIFKDSNIICANILIYAPLDPVNVEEIPNKTSAEALISSLKKLNEWLNE